MTRIDIGNNLLLVLKESDRRANDMPIHIEVYKNNIEIQPIIRFDRISNYNQYTLFKWRDAGCLPDSIETVADPYDDDDYRLIIQGVDEI